MPNFMLTAEDVKAVLQERLFIHLLGFTKYKDVFDRDRETRFRFRWAESGIPFLAGSWEMSGIDIENLQT
jgi:hypothetical protein